MVKTAAIYARVSSQQQKEDNTIASQTAALNAAELERRLAAAHAAEPSRRRQETLERELLRLNKAMERLVTAYQEDLLSLEELRARLPDLRRRAQGTQAELRAIADQTAERAATRRRS